MGIATEWEQSLFCVLQALTNLYFPGVHFFDMVRCCNGNKNQFYFYQGSFKMAKQRKTNSGVSALGSLLSTIGTVAAVELADNPEALAEVTKMTANVADSNLMTAAALQDDAIEAFHDAEERAEAEQAEEQAEEQEEQAEQTEEQEQTEEDTD